MDNTIFKGEETFLKDILTDFHCKINFIETNNISDFKEISSKWIKNKLQSNNKNPKRIFKVMENHKESKFLFTSIMGFFYQYGIGCELNKKKAIELYLLAINNENFNILHLNDEDNNLFFINKNIIIGKYLLSLLYYKDIILDINRKQNVSKFSNIFKLAENGDLEAQYNLAICYMDGIGTQKNEIKAFECK
ncbi:unnamed protein product [Rhizophagus irregularis]|nr:unnamed protein product [Rhizophagus irregularis]